MSSRTPQFTEASKEYPLLHSLRQERFSSGSPVRADAYNNCSTTFPAGRKPYFSNHLQHGVPTQTKSLPRMGGGTHIASRSSGSTSSAYSRPVPPAFPPPPPTIPDGNAQQQDHMFQTRTRGVNVCGHLETERKVPSPDGPENDVAEHGLANEKKNNYKFIAIMMTVLVAIIACAFGSGIPSKVCGIGEWSKSGNT